MKEIINKALLFFTNVETLLVALIAATLPFKLNLGNFAIIISTIYVIYLLVKKKVSVRNFRTFYFYIPLLLFFISILSALTSKDIDQGVHQLEKLLLMVLLPLILCVFKGRDVDLNKVFYCFVFGVTAATSILLTLNIFKFLEGEPTFKLFFFDFTMLYDQHPVYFSTNIVLSLFFLIHHFLFKNKGFIKTYQIYIMVLINLIGLFFCASKAVITILFILMVLYFFINKNISKIIKRLFLGVFLLGFTAVLSVPYVKDRFVEGLEYNSNAFSPTVDLLESKKFTYEEKTNISDLELRVIFAKIGIYHVLKDRKFLFGYGLGDVQHHLDYYYMSYNLAPNWYEGFNLHNQYIQYLVTYGVLTLLIFVYYLIQSLIISIKGDNVLHLFFMIMIMFLFIFEVYLARNKGIVLLFFFNTLFLTQKFKFESSHTRHERCT